MLIRFPNRHGKVSVNMRAVETITLNGPTIYIGMLGYETQGASWGDDPPGLYEIRCSNERVALSEYNALHEALQAGARVYSIQTKTRATHL